MRVGALAGVALAMLAACGGETTTLESTVPPLDATTTVVETSTTVMDTTLPPTTASTTSTTQAPTTSTSAPVPGFSLYDEVDPPTVPAGHTDDFSGVDGLADGQYWTVYIGGETDVPVVEVYQAFFGEECVTEAELRGDECLNDIYVPSDEYRTLDDVPFAVYVFLTVADASTQRSFWITPDELVTIRAGRASAGAPEGFEFVPFAFLMTVRDGEIVAFEQVWTP